MTEYLRAQVMQLSPASKILDLGCGDMSLLSDIAQIRCDVQLHGVDIGDIPQIARNIRFTNCDVTTFVADAEYQMVLAVDILEHLPRPELLVKTAWNALAEEGSFYTIVPSVTKLLLFGDDNFFADYSHVRPFSCKSMTRLLQDHGFEVSSTASVGHVKKSNLRMGYYLLRGLVTQNAAYLNAAIKMIGGTTIETLARKKS